jgi:type VI secretion system protein VasD
MWEPVMTVRLKWRAGWRAVLIALMAPMVLAAGCAKPPPPPPPPPPPTVIDITVAVAADVNPDARGRASPLVARLFELKSLAAFDGADFFALSEKDKDTLGPDLVAKEELLLQPGEQRQFKRTLDPATRFVAVVAAYRDIERARWRASMPVALNKTTAVKLGAQQRAITIGPAAGLGLGSAPARSDPGVAVP